MESNRVDLLLVNVLRVFFIKIVGFKFANYKYEPHVISSEVIQLSATNLNYIQDTYGNENSLGTGNEVLGQQFLTFNLAGEEYGINITRVQEIKGWLPVTKLPNTPDYVSGVLNLRGNIVPIIDMRSRFNLEKIDYSQNTVIIVLSVGASKNIGIIVDAVSDVLNVNKEEIKDAPDFGENIKVEMISGLTTSGDKLVMLLDIDRFLMSYELETIEDKILASELK